MNYKHLWAVPGKVVQTRIWGESEVPVIQQMLLELFSDFFDTSEHEIVHHIVSAQDAIGIPNLAQLSGVLPRKPHPHAGWTIIFTQKNFANQLFRFMMLFATSLSNSRYQQTFSVEESHDVLSEIDTRIDWSQEVNQGFLTAPLEEVLNWKPASIPPNQPVI